MIEQGPMQMQKEFIIGSEHHKESGKCQKAEKKKKTGKKI
jgi:hypothetical protein